MRGIRRHNLSRFLQSRVFMALVKVLPWMVSFYFLWLVTMLYFLLNREDRRIVRKNIHEVFGKSRSSRELDGLFWATLKGIFRHYFEKLFLACTTDRQWQDYFKKKIRISGRRHLDRFFLKRKGVILVTAHFGAVEFLPGFLTLLGYPVAIIAKFKTRRLREKCREQAAKVGARIIDASEPNSFFSALCALKEGRVLITECDEVECWKPYPGRSIPLFGTSFQVDRILTILQRRSGAPVVFGYVRREEKGRYVAEIENLRQPGGAMPDGLAEAVLKKFERLVYTHPDQWYIWKNFQRMKVSGREGVTGEDREGDRLSVKASPGSIIQPLRGFPQLHGQYCCQTPV
ncbi:MAG: lysophospholipid acyltransferase family protein [Deltaproteobacteria bacterium]|nr:lysophospholipid acyltransferase family protein [Deltaproteobacteria bacterium]MBW2120548.1 lysophospholipid acyltransferase family protein [Deltaproteobacteria bacterium]